MSASHFTRVRELFAEALELPGSEREAFVRAQAGDEAIAAEVLRLLGLDEQPQMQTAQAMQVIAEAEAAPLPQGRRVGKYELFEVLGEGGMGQVYRARRVDGPEHWVALKLMRRGLFSGASESRFLAEQQFLARLNHAGIAHYIDSGTYSEGQFYVAMELVQGQRLRDFAKARGLNAKQRVELFRQLLAAVSYAHRQLIIHRDLKQANVLVTDSGVVKLLDFGIAKLLQDQPEMTGTRERLYTPTCAAPEQIRGGLCDVTTDVYALGVLLYELIAGKSIFDTEGKTPGEFENLVLNVPPPDMRSRLDPDYGCKDIPADLERIVAKAIRKEPNRRYTSVEQFDADLERLLANEPVSVSGNGWLYRTRKFLSRNKLASTLTAVTALAILVGFAITLQQNREIRAERDRANLALDAMKQAFLGADPGGEAGGEVSARDILEKSTENLLPLLARGDNDFTNLASVLFEVQLSMGHFKDADRVAAAVGLSRLLTDFKFCILSARLLAEQRDFDRARDRISSCPSPLTEGEAIMRDLTQGRIAVRSGLFPDAIAAYSSVLPKLTTDDPRWVYGIEQYAYALARNQQTQKALDVIRAAQARASKSLPATHPTISRIDLGKLYVLQVAGYDAEVARQGPAVIASLAGRLGERSVLLGRAYSMVGASQMNLKPIENSIPNLKAAMGIYSFVYGPDHMETLRREANLALVMMRVANPPRDVSQRFEHLLEKSTEAERALFAAFLQISYGQWLSESDLHEAALRQLTSINPLLLQKSSKQDMYFYDVMLNYAYWKNKCGNDPTGEFTPLNACLGIPRLTEICFRSREALCTKRDSEIYLVTHDDTRYSMPSGEIADEH